MKQTSFSISDLKKINEVTWEIPRDYRQDMKVPARIFATEKMVRDILKDRSLWQIVNVATLSGISRYALAMPDIHEGYGFPVGGVAAMSAKDGVISPGGIGYDINCGVRLLISELSFREAEPYLDKLADNIYREVP
ncbi:MAG: RtcB family protein, partial [Patescibacteria group bacterium]